MNLLFQRRHQRFETLVQQYQNRLYGFACYFLGDREAAADVIQDVLLRFWQHHDEVEEARLFGWLLRVTRNACLDELRKRKVQRGLMLADPEGVERAAGSGPTPEGTAEAADFHVQLERALARIAEPYRTIVILREVQDLKYEEISGAMDLPLNTVKVYLHRGRKMLREQLSEVIERETA